MKNKIIIQLMSFALVLSGAMVSDVCALGERSRKSDLSASVKNPVTKAVDAAKKKGQQVARVAEDAKDIIGKEKDALVNFGNDVYASVANAYEWVADNANTILNYTVGATGFYLGYKTLGWFGDEFIVNRIINGTIKYSALAGITLIGGQYAYGKHLENQNKALQQLDKKVAQELELYKYMTTDSSAITFGLFSFDHADLDVLSKDIMKNFYSARLGKKHLKEIKFVDLDGMIEYAYNKFITPEKTIDVFGNKLVNNLNIDSIIKNWGAKFKDQEKPSARAAIHVALGDTHATPTRKDVVVNDLYKTFATELLKKLNIKDALVFCVEQEIKVLNAICDGFIAQSNDTILANAFGQFIASQYNNDVKALIIDIRKYVSTGSMEHPYDMFEQYCNNNDIAIVLSSRYLDKYLNAFAMRMLLEDVILPMVKA